MRGAENGTIFTCFGLHIRSAIELPEVEHDVRADDLTLPVVDIRVGVIPQRISATGDVFQYDDGRALLDVAGVARYLIRDGHEIVVDIVPNAPMRSVRLFLLGSAFGILCQQRGLLPLHANAIVTPQGTVVAFAGPSGAGKSTLAAYFQQAGYEVLCDDVCALSFDEVGRPFAWPGLPRLKLWKDAATSFGYDSPRLEFAFEGLEKYHVPFARQASRGPFPFERLYLLGVSESDASAGITRLDGAAAYEAIAAQTYRAEYLGPMGLRRSHFRQSISLLRHAQVYSARRRWGFDLFGEEAERLQRHFLETLAEPFRANEHRCV